jgi:alkylated DNA repair protein (DNA oxidative demethylase)
MTMKPADGELGVVLAQLERLGARLVAVGHGRDPRSRRAAELFVATWTAGLDPDGDPREVAEVVDWPADAASWLRPAVAAAEPGALDGMVGATAEGGLWFIEGSTFRRHTPRAADSALGELFPRPPVEIAPGAVHVPDWLDLEQQGRLVQACREWSQGPAPMRHAELPRGGKMSVQTVCLGWHWTPYRYTRTAIDQGDAPVTPFPDWLGDLARRAVADAYGGEEEAASYRPDAALINFYDETAKLGMHQDKDERSGAPVVSLSIGDTCTFRFGNTADRGAPYTDVELRSGDLFVFGGPSRFAYHGVVNGTQAGTGDPSTGLDGGRLNLTLRETGLADPRDL